MREYIYWGACVIGAFIEYFFGGFDGLIHALFTLIAIDYITGVFAAGIKHELSSNIGFKGIKRKITILLLVGMAHVIDRELLGNSVFLRNGVICFYLSNEGLSILENAVDIGIPFPKIVKEKLLMFRDESDKGSKKSDK